jgi:23S rRNA G2069 N7-methylase RlmK/C1962 C5-methylase RlmI
LFFLVKGFRDGLFLDMAEGRRWAQAHAQGPTVHNLFTYTCATSSPPKRQTWW